MIEDVKKYFKKSKPTHDFNHTLRVLNLCMHIGENEGASLKVLRFAALLHDVGRQEADERKVDHAELGAEIARSFLEKKGFDKGFIEKVTSCILTHRFRGENIPKTLEAKILYDADKLDAVGAIGIARAYSYAGENSQKLYSDFDESYRITKIIDHKNHTPVVEFLVKLSKIKDKMLTKEGKRLAEERHRFMEEFFERLKREVEGEV
ncbi:MAG: HD domain-containing protein [Candidatus Methanofastidiosia archaeon]